MKKSSILILIIICLCSCGKSSKKVSITGEIKGLGTDTLYLYGMDESFDRIDTIFAKNDKFSYLTMLMKSAFVKYFANSRSVAAFLANEESLATALFKLLVTIEELLVLAPKTAIR